jgi:hypothetical protein
VVATKALACKLAKAAWYLMSEETEYDSKRMFGERAKTKWDFDFWVRLSASEKGWLEALGTDWRQARSTFSNCGRSEGKDLQVIRPCRESTTGWTLAPTKGLPNQSSYELNEHGPALNVFWSRKSGMGALSIARKTRKTRKDKDPEAFNMKKTDPDRTKKASWWFVR